MLKWAVTGTNRQSHLQRTRTTEPSTSAPIRQRAGARRSVSNASGACGTSTNGREKLRRKSTGHELTNIRRKVIHRDKENNLTSTPLPLSTYATSPLRRLDSLKDLSNISLTPNKIVTPPHQTPKNSKPPDKRSPSGSSSSIRNNPSQYATTLPTFDVEYSPCGVIPGPILALRGVGIADSYFEKPRYLSDEIPECEEKPLSATPLSSQISKFSFTRPKNNPAEVNTNYNEEESLSSSRMGDVTLDRMIDAILESARKERRPAKSKQSSSHIMSPTYTPAEDPASDLNEIWDPRSAKYLQSDKKRKSLQGNPINIYNEREVKTPECLQEMLRNCSETPTTIENNELSCHLKRQKAVRRKRKLSITSSVKHSAQKLFTQSSFLRRNLDQLAEMDTPKEYSNLSPDSGRNSASDLEESPEDINFSKRRLLFSPVQFKINEDNP